MDTRLLENIKNLYRRISSAAIRSGRSPFDVKLVAVTKTVISERIMEAIDLGLRIFGENRVQEAKEKISNLKSQINPLPPTFNKGGWGGFELEWHLIGYLQKNKAKTAVQLFDMIQTIDSADIAELINKYAEREGKTQRVLIQVKLSEEETKHGISKEKLMDLIKAVSNMENLKLEGLMTMPQFFDDPEKARPYFIELRELRDKAERLGYKLPELSMGMTNDFEVAILEGATMVRIGRAIFGARR
ncbi:MAG: YggS family pyridoxal phosphate-dependent enzyme [Nitrospirae bacterium]|jgi:PLP dependent protein|nr:YggS family pyridoxal phosphate-dependent enzyme [Nitrospirota bacterium]